jgi:hypothetical protein
MGNRGRYNWKILIQDKRICYLVSQIDRAGPIHLAGRIQTWRKTAVCNRNLFKNIYFWDSTMNVSIIYRIYSLIENLIPITMSLEHLQVYHENNYYLNLPL